MWQRGGENVAKGGGKCDEMIILILIFKGFPKNKYIEDIEDIEEKRKGALTSLRSFLRRKKKNSKGKRILS
jgi:hypothetical protein